MHYNYSTWPKPCATGRCQNARALIGDFKKQNDLGDVAKLKHPHFYIKEADHMGSTFVTFETMFTGLERQFTNITQKVTKENYKILEINNKIANLENEKQDIDSKNEDTMSLSSYEVASRYCRPN